MGNNKRNILFFKVDSMFELYKSLDEWQIENEKRFLSLNIYLEDKTFNCIALTNPTEVVIVGADNRDAVMVVDGQLAVEAVIVRN